MPGVLGERGGERDRGGADPVIAGRAYIQEVREDDMLRQLPPGSAGEETLWLLWALGGTPAQLR